MRWGILVGLLFTPALVFAADPALPSRIVPTCTDFAGSLGICQACDFVKLIQNLLQFFIGFAVFAVTIMFAYAGILYVTAASNHSNLESAKKIFWNALLGFVLVLVAYLVVDLILRVFTGSSLNVLTRIDCVTRKYTGSTLGYETVPEPPRVTDPRQDGPAEPGAPGEEGKGLDAVDSNTNYNPIACQVIHNYESDCEGMSAAGWPGQRGQECLQGCIGSANGKRIITVADYKYCQGNSGGNLPAISQTSGWQSFPSMSCSQVLSNGVTVATPVDSGIPRGQRFTWPELAARYGLPADTVFTADDSYGDQGCGSKTGCIYGHPTGRPDNYSVDVARCIQAPNYTVTCSEKSYHSSVPMKTKPTPVPGG